MRPWLREEKEKDFFNLAFPRPWFSVVSILVSFTKKHLAVLAVFRATKSYGPLKRKVA